MGCTSRPRPTTPVRLAAASARAGQVWVCLGRDIGRHTRDVVVSDLSIRWHMRMMNMAQAIMPMPETTPSEAATTVANQVRNDASDADEANDANDQAKPFSVRCGERQSRNHGVTALYRRSLRSARPLSRRRALPEAIVPAAVA